MQTTTAGESSKDFGQSTPKGSYELRFWSLFHQGRALSFPCDSEGHVDLDHLTERARNNYFYARSVIGREFTCPQVTPSTTH